MRTPTALAIALLLLVSLAAPLAGIAGAQEMTDHPEADLHIEQPSYIDSDVARQTDNGTTIYEARGEAVTIVPTNVDRENVTGYGKDTDAGSFTFDDDLEVWTLDANGETGTFELYWLVEEPVEEENATGTETVRYEATVRLSDTNGVYLTQSEFDERQDMVDLGEKADSVVNDLKGRWLPFFDTSGEAGDVIDRMGSVAATIGNPLNMFSSGYLGFHTLLLVSLGAMLAALQYLGFFAWVVHKLRGQNHDFEQNEAHEGEIAERQLEVDERDRLNKLANMDWFDIFEDDHIARAFRDHLGETVLGGWIRLNAAIRPRNVVRDRLQAMGQAGYVAVATFDRSLEIDADDEDVLEPVLESVDLVREDSVDADALDEQEAIAPLTEAAGDAPCDLEAILETVDWCHDELVAFDFENADVNPTRLETPIETLDLETLIERLDADMTHFEDEEQYGEYLHSFVASVREHPFTEDDGTPDELRYIFNNLLQAAQLLEDRYGFPLGDYQSDAFETAVDSYDRSARAAAYSEEVSTGAA
ncbi:hypothetical protein ACFQO4_20680 [Saliphagus sp. GCM10025334]